MAVSIEGNSLTSAKGFGIVMGAAVVSALLVGVVYPFIVAKLSS